MSAGPFERSVRRQYRFGEYELDLEGGSLRRGGDEVALRPKSFEVLSYLVERHGRLVTKAELIESVWRDAAVTDNSLSQCLLEIRRGLHDDGQETIRTVARRGYVFTAPVTVAPFEFPRPPLEPAPRLLPAAERPGNRKVWGAVISILIPLALGLFIFRTTWLPTPVKPVSFTQITNFADSALWPAVSPDGRILAFYRGENDFLTTDQIYVKFLPNGEPVQLTHDARLKYGLSFSPDGSRIAYTVAGDAAGWRTVTISPAGGEPRVFLPNCAGLSWLDPHTLLFSEMRNVPHMGVVMASPDRSNSRDIYWPAHQRGMAHYSIASPDRKWALIVEMNPDWLPCRLVALSGSSPSRQVGPPGECTAAAWSPDGKWMYFGVKVDGRRHLWRQSFPYGQPERITAQPIEERGIAVMPIDGSLITSLSMSQNTLWMHDSKGEHPLSTEGYATAVDDGAGRPVFSADGKRLYYLLRDSLESSDELRRRDMDSGAIETILPGVDVRNFDISPDEKEVIYSVHPAGQPSQLWLAALDRRSPPRRIASGGEAVPHFGPNGRIVFRMDEGKAHYLAIMDRDGSDRTKLLPYPIVDFGTMSPDRRIAVVFTGARPADPSHAAAMLAVPTRGGTPRPICLNCPITWSPDGKYFLLGSPSWHDDPNGRTVAIPVPAGETLPHLPEGGFGAEIDPATIPGARVITHNYVVPSRDPFTYAYVKTSTHSNLFRIQFH